MTTDPKKNALELLVTILPTNNPVENFEVEHDFPYIGKKLMLLNAHRIELQGQYKDRILLAIEDITERRENHFLLFTRTNNELYNNNKNK